MVIKLLNQYQLIAAKTAFDTLFQSSDPFDEPFNSIAEKRLILYPVEYQLDENQYEAIAVAARVIGESVAYLSLIEGYKGEPFEENNHWQVDLDSYPYEALRSQEGWFPLMENAIYSTNGMWGLIISHEGHAVVGGPGPFIETLKTNLPVPEDEQIREFLAVWKDNRDRLGSNIDWLPRLLAHVYGQEKAEKLLVKADLV